MKSLLKVFALSFLLLVSTVAQVNAQTTPKLEIAAPTTDQTIYGNKVPILFNVTNFQLTDSQDTKAQAGQGYILVWLDDQNPTPESATKVTSDTFTYSDVSYGDHVLSAELVTSDNKSLTPPQKVTVKFKSAEVASTQDAQVTSSFDKNTALVILVVVALVIIAAWWYTKDEDDENPVTKAVTAPKSKTKTKTTKKVKKVTKKKK